MRTVIAPPQPVAGSGFTVPVPESQHQTLIAVSFRIVTSAVVATRGPFVQVTDGSSVALVTVASGYSVTASSTADYTFAVGLSEWDSVGVQAASGGLPPLVLGEGDSILVGVSAIDPGDQISRIRIVLDQTPVRA